jgi:DNA-binding response OmpR family regulator
MSEPKTHVLVVDDKPEYLWLLQIHLEEAGYEVSTTTDGQNALERAAAERPDLIILDVKMHGMDGYEVCQRIRQFSCVPIIMISAVGRVIDKIRGLDAGADQFVTKPFNADELLARVQALLRRVRLARARLPLGSPPVDGGPPLGAGQKTLYAQDSQ